MYIKDHINFQEIKTRKMKNESVCPPLIQQIFSTCLENTRRNKKF